MKNYYFLLVLLMLSTSIFANPDIPEEKETVTVHIYRPKRLVGFGWTFHLKVNNEVVAKVKNGKAYTLELPSDEFLIQLKKSKITINPESGKEYYFRAYLVRNMFLGKPELVLVEKEFAQNEMKAFVKP
ncbi:MAG: DUF2846 domain-containing protein [Flammeovirgaceae bacterium]|nr:DUF2846 domain-containing protein [Flammeovirgaceae bacterium]